MLLNTLKQVNNQRGSVLLIITMMVLTIIILLGSTYVYLSGSTRLNSTSYYERTQAYYIAEAGIEKALVKLKDDVNWSFGSYQEDFGKGKIESVSVSSSGNIYTITSVGEFQGAKKTLTAVVEINSGGLPFSQYNLYFSDSNNKVFKGPSGGKATLKSDIYDIGNFNLTGNATIEGSLYVVGDVNIKGSVDITGDVFATGNVTYNKRENITGSINGGYSLNIPPFDLTESDFEKLKISADAQGKYYETDPGIDLSQLNGIYFVNGDVEISGTYSGKGTIVATGNITCTNSVRRTTPKDILCLIAKGDIITDKNNSEYYFLAFTQGIFKTEKKCDIYGAIITREGIEFANNTNFTYDETIANQQPGLNLPDMELLTNTTLNIKSWQ